MRSEPRPLEVQRLIVCKIASISDILLPMSPEQPHTVRQWLSHIDANGPSMRPFPKGDSDLIHPESYPDKEGIKPERAALSAIFSVRAYQLAKKALLARAETVSAPSSNTLDVLGLIEKNRAIGEAFQIALADGITQDEARINSMPRDAVVSRAYRRLAFIMKPIANRITNNQKNGRVDVAPGYVVHKPSPVFIDIYSGVSPLSQNINAMIKLGFIRYQRENGRDMPTPELLSKLANSYDSHIRPMASVHKADEKLLVGSLFDMPDSLGIDGDRFVLNPQILEKVRAERVSRKGEISALTRCVFLTSTQDLQPFLDEPADFDDPMKDAFDLLVGFLKA